MFSRSSTSPTGFWKGKTRRLSQEPKDEERVVVSGTRSARTRLGELSLVWSALSERTRFGSDLSLSRRELCLVVLRRNLSCHPALNVSLRTKLRRPQSVGLEPASISSPCSLGYREPETRKNHCDPLAKRLRPEQAMYRLRQKSQN
jgi:hypothetical protein